MPNNQAQTEKAKQFPRVFRLTRQSLIIAILTGLFLAGLAIFLLERTPASPLGLSQSQLRQAQQQARQLQQVKQELNQKYPDWELKGLKNQLDFYLNQVP